MFILSCRSKRGTNILSVGDFRRIGGPQQPDRPSPSS
jgi:hypothetical protein